MKPGSVITAFVLLGIGSACTQEHSNESSDLKSQDDDVAESSMMRGSDVIDNAMEEGFDAAEAARAAGAELASEYVDAEQTADMAGLDVAGAIEENGETDDQVEEEPAE